MTYRDMSIGERIRIGRGRREWSQTDLGARLDMEQPTVADLERGVRPPTGEESLALAQVLQVTVGWLLGEPEQPPELSIRERAARWAEEIPHEIPVIDQEAHAGLDADAPILGHAYWPESMIRGRNIIGLRVRCNRVSPDIKPGDTIFVDRDGTAAPGNFVFACVDDKMHLWRAGSRSDHLWLMNNESDVPADEVQIEGVVIQLSRAL